MYHSNSHRSSVHAHSPSHRYSQSRTNYATPPPASNPYQAQQLQHQPSRRSQAPGVPDQNQLYQWFRKVDTDNSGEISVQELQAALINGDWSRFDLDTVKMLMNLFDVDRSGSIGFNEFQGLWKYIVDWQQAFKYFDRDGSGTIDGQELANALRQFGYNLSPTILSLVEQKYGKLRDDESAPPPAPAPSHAVPGLASAPYSGQGPPPGISFDRFVRACVFVKNLTEAFQRKDTDRDGWIQVNYEEFLKMVLMAP